jgi:adenylate cyclase
MGESKPKRQLAAIMFTDIVGYSALIGEDESRTLAILKKNRQLQRSLIKKYRGTWLKEIGDGELNFLRKR